LRMPYFDASVFRSRLFAMRWKNALDAASSISGSGRS
jgi:hypothetical protein